MVKGLVYSVVASATGRLTRNGTASNAAVSICSGPGTRPENMPTATPPATEWRFRCHRLGCCRKPPKRAICLLLRTLSWLGRYFLKNLRGIGLAVEITVSMLQLYELITRIGDIPQGDFPLSRQAGPRKGDRDLRGASPHASLSQGPVR